jgi:hypothetical protein
VSVSAKASNSGHIHGEIEIEFRLEFRPLGFGENAEGKFTAQLGSHGGVGERLEDPFHTTGGRLPDGEVKIGCPALTGFGEELENIEFAHDWDWPL